MFSKSIIIFIFLTMLALFFTHMYISMTVSPVQNSEMKLIEISKGMTMDEIAVRLKQEQLIKSIWLFKLLLRWRSGMTIKAGQYRLSACLTMLQLLDIIEQGKVFFLRVTIPEGQTMSQIADLLSKQGLGEKQDFLKYLLNQKYAQTLSIEATTLEGYLFPDTYFFNKGLSEEAIIATMVERFWTIFRPEWQDRSRELGFTLHQVVTLASLIEKETAKRDEKPLVSAVYHNRLRQGIRLQCDPTVIYSLDQFDGNLTREDLANDSPYNTYRRSGLPPGPIANPGEDSLRAALYPAQVDYYYFVSKNDGTHYFSFDLKEHNQAVLKYQKQK